MTLDDIKNAIDAGKTVHWANTSYVVRKDQLGQYLIVYLPNGSAIGLTNRAGTQLNGRVGDFFPSDRENPARAASRRGTEK